MQKVEDRPEIVEGLKGVYFATSDSSFIDGDVGKLLYRGYSIHDLAEGASIEEVIHLLLYSKLPNKQELASVDAQLKANRALPAPVIDVIRATKDAHPMDVLRGAISALSAFDEETEVKPQRQDMQPYLDAVLRKGIRLTAQAPAIVAAHYRIKNGLEPLAPRDDLGQAANFIYMLFGREPSEAETHIFDVDFVLHAEHGSNASAFAARVTASTWADLHCAIVSAIGTLKGPAHGGAAESVMEMCMEIGSPDNVDAYLDDRFAKRERIMGFGHRVYKVEDPRARHLRDRARDLGNEKGEPQWFQILQQIEKRMEKYQDRGIYVNVDFYAGAIYYLLGIPEELFVPIFAIGRVPGWVLQCIEQYKNNELLRPLTYYTGPMDVPFVPLEQRS